MATVRDIEVELTGLEDGILGDLGYREFTVTVGSTVLSPVPEVEEMPASRISQVAYSKYVQALGGNGNPTNIYKLTVSRLIPEATVRQQSYWTLQRGTFVGECLPVEIVVSDSRYNVVLALIKRVS